MIFICEDDLNMAQDLCGILIKYGYSAVYAQDFSNVAQDIISRAPELVLLDINLPQFDGFHICREVRRVSDVPIIMLTSRESEIDELMSMNLGADDYVTKPFNMQILLAHISSVLRRANRVIENTLTHRGVTLDPTAGMLRYGEQSMELTKNEQRILLRLMQSKGAIVTRAQLMDALWQDDEFIDDNTLTVNINRLRRKLESVGVHDFLITRRGQGYMV
ncbi:MAG: response regulator transcription factor [Candidatus Spyradocola sp.]|nr:response regulator transcription factor [Candidatus Spyradocola sp.]